jgi:hypothetical protein
MPRQRKCANCAKTTPTHNSITLNNRYLCARCCNETFAGPEFQHIDFDPLPVNDFTGTTHIFHFLLRHLGDKIAINAFELHEGYTFQIIDDADTDPLALFGKLVQRIQRALAVRHIVKTPFGPIIEEHDTVTATITSDPDRVLPALIIDGQRIGWNQLGYMLRTYEGFQFQLQIRDKSEEFDPPQKRGHKTRK